MNIYHLFQCASCGKEIDSFFVHVLKPLPNGEYEEVSVCTNCVTRYETVQFLRIRLDTLPFILEKESPFWINDVAFHDLFDGKQATLVGQLPLDAFPLMEDFEVVLEAFVKKHLLERTTLEYEVKFFSASHGYLAYFSGNQTAQDLCREDFVVPCGTFAAPFIDVEQRWGWSLLIAEDETWVYVLTYHETEPVVCYFPAFEDYEQNVWFKVEKSRYYRQWEKAVYLCHAYYHRTHAGVDGVVKRD